jgi:glycosyltransferase involved in cell wall biosynthesis
MRPNLKSGDKLKILWISHVVPYPPKGGLLMRSHFLLTELSKHNNVDLITLNQENLLLNYFDSVESGLLGSREMLSNTIDDIDIIPFEVGRTNMGKIILALKTLFSLKPYSVAWLYSSILKASIVKQLKHKKYDIIHFDTLGLSQYLPLFNKYQICTLDHHNIESQMMIRRAKKEGNLFKKAYYWQEGIKLRLYEKKIANQFHAHITCSDLDKERLLSFNRDIQVYTIPNPVIVPCCDKKNRPANKKNIKSLLFIGGLDWYPNTDAVIHFCKDILPHIQNKISSIEFNIVGKNPSQEIINIAKKNSAINLFGYVPDISSFYNNCDLYICPIRDGGGTKLKVVDAMANSSAVIGYPEAFEGLNTINDENCFICETKEEMISKTVSLLEKPDRLVQVRKNAKSFVKNNYSVEIVGERLNSFYKKLVAENE